MTKTERNRKLFALGLSAIATAITLASAAATYSINVESFSDWGTYTARTLALMATFGIELLFALLLYGIANAITGTNEKILAVSTLLLLLLIMGTNYTIHRQVVKGIALSPWQQTYYEWIGAALLFVIAGIVILFKAISYESQERSMERDIAFAARRKGLEWKQAALDSPEMNDYLDDYQNDVFDEVRRTIDLPARRPYRTMAAPAPALSVKRRPNINQIPPRRGPKNRETMPDLDDSGKE